VFIGWEEAEMLEMRYRRPEGVFTQKIGAEGEEEGDGRIEDGGRKRFEPEGMRLEDVELAKEFGRYRREVEHAVVAVDVAVEGEDAKAG
jgi:hypothetical protein